MKDFVWGSSDGEILALQNSGLDFLKYLILLNEKLDKLATTLSCNCDYQK